MSGRIVIGGVVLVIVLVVLAIMLVVGSNAGGDSDRGRRETAPARTTGIQSDLVRPGDLHASTR